MVVTVRFQMDACRMEHVISEESFKALKEHAKEKL